MVKFFPHLFILLSVMYLPACFLGWTEIEDATLTTALVNQPYTFNLQSTHHNWGVSWRNDYFFKQTGGGLPPGVGVAADGQIVGTPTQTGEFKFEVSVYSLEEGLFETDEDLIVDSEWFTLFVTEASSNEDCPGPADESTRELFLCAGRLTEEEMRQDDTLELDISYFVNVEQSQEDNYDIQEISFDLQFDSESFAVDSSLLTSALLREAATRTEADVDYDLNEGRLSVHLDATEKAFSRPGRLMVLPLKATSDLTLENYEFNLSDVVISPEDEDVDLPDIVSLNGSLTVETPSSENVD